MSIRTEEDLAAVIERAGPRGVRLAKNHLSPARSGSTRNDSGAGDKSGSNSRARHSRTVESVALLKGPVSFAIPGAPISKPRQSQSDKWKKRSCVLRYREWADGARRMLKAATGIERLIGASGIFATFYIPMPDSWSKKKQDEMNGKPHRQKIDLDNAAKALCDALIVHDETVYRMELQKYWCRPENAKVAVVLFP